jgi:hypothetical protein
MLKHALVSLLLLGIVVLYPAAARAQGEAVRTQITLQGTVTAVDYTQRTVTIMGKNGNVLTIDVASSVTRFDQVKVGDIIEIEYYDRVNVRLKPPGEPDVDRTIPATKTPAPGLLPGGTLAAQRVATVTITGWDPATRTISFTGPRGTAYSRRLLDTTDPSIVAGLKQGDRVDVTWTEAVRVSMKSGAAAAPAAQQPPPPDSFRNRFTLSAQYGVDNPFSGHLIKETTGQTRSGVPINLAETGYGDVYGVMTMFKVGVGYRISPRNEAVVNFVLEQNSADLVQIGTASAANVPITVQFDDYKYWGFEVGQRFYFTRVRFTPYLGYLVGVNRYDDIRGEFVNISNPALLPGYAAQDHVFFEKSWAFSFGPTGGLLIGVGPIEIMGEIQFRFMGGQSDVDWLVEEGLRDINEDSQRWSFPILVGARIRF